MARNERINKRIACTGKRQYTNRLQAANALMQGRILHYYAEGYEIYDCWFCPCFHIGKWRGWKGKRKAK